MEIKGRRNLPVRDCEQSSSAIFKDFLIVFLKSSYEQY